MISVIIPTVLKCPKVLLKLIGVLSSDSVVSEIIIIENSGKGLFLPPNDKIKIHNPEQNLYVNSSLCKTGCTLNSINPQTPKVS